MPITASQIEVIARNNPNGVSIDLITGRVLTGVGFCVAYEATQDNYGLTGLKASLAHALGPEGAGIIGSWSHDGKIYYDSVKKYYTRGLAVTAAQQENQIAIYNLLQRQVEDIMLPGLGFHPRVAGSLMPSLRAHRKRCFSF